MQAFRGRLGRADRAFDTGHRRSASRRSGAERRSQRRLSEASIRAKPGVVTRPSGLQYNIIKNGFGKRPLPTDTVTVCYTGMLINGKVFDGTEPMTPATFTVNKLIPGWTEALGLMREGDKWHLVIPSDLAYGARGAGDGLIPPNQTLVFDMELLSDRARGRRTAGPGRCNGNGQQ